MESIELNRHKELKNRVIDLLSNAEEEFLKIRSDIAKQNAVAFEELKQKTAKGRFSIVVVGEFSAGKSTFLNALMQERYLESFTNETTATINFLKSVKDSPKGKPLLKVFYKDGNIVEDENVSFENISKYVSTRGENVAQKIEYVEIYLDSPILNEEVELIDSPGLNGTAELHADKTKKQIKESHAAIFMFRATQPGSKTDFETLVSLKKNCDSVIIVLNQIDLAIKESEHETVDDIINKLQENFKKYFPNEKLPEIWPLSSYKALVARSKYKLDFNGRIEHTEAEKKQYLETSRITKFEERLMRYITQGEKAKAELISPVKSVIKNTEGTIQSLQEENETLRGKFSTEEIDLQIEAVTDELNKANATIKENKSKIDDRIYEAIQNAKNAIKSQTKDLKDNTLKGINSATEIEILEHNSQQVVNSLIQKYNSIYFDVINELQSEFKKLVGFYANDAISEISKKVDNDTNTTLNLGDTSIDKKFFDIDLDFSKYEEEFERLNNQIDELYDKQSKSLIEEETRSRIEKMILETQERLERNENKYNNMINALGDRPKVEDVVTTVNEKRGWWNPARWFGHDYRYETLYTKDDTAQKQYDEDKKRIQNQYEDKNNSIERELEDLRTKLGDLPMSRTSNVQHKIDRLEKEKERLDEKKRRELGKAIKTKMEGAQGYLSAFFDDIEAKSRKKMLESVQAKEDAYLALGLMIAEQELKGVLDEKKKKLENLKNKRQMAEDDKVKTIVSNETTITSLSNLLMKAKDVLAAIESIETDTIKNS